MKKKYRFYSLYLETTRECNAKCYMCMTGCDDKQFVEEKKKDEMTLNEIEKYVFKPAKELGVEQIGLSGGEFFLRKDALDLVKSCSDHKYQVRIVTNGSFIEEPLLRELKRITNNNLVLAFGINSIKDIEVNQDTRDLDLNVTLKGLELCKKLKVTPHVVVNVGKFNLNDLKDTYKWLSDNNIAVNRAPFSGRNSGQKYFNDESFTKEDMEKFIHPVYKKNINGFLSYTPFFLSPELHDRVSHGEKNVSVPQNPAIGCWVGSLLTVTPEGDVAPCILLLDSLKAGNVREKSLYDIVDQSEIFQNLLDRDNLKGKCGRCRYNKTCGGCRAMAYYRTGDYMAEDPSCFFEPIDKSTVSEHEEETNENFKKYVLLAHQAGLYKKNKVKNYE